MKKYAGISLIILVITIIIIIILAGTIILSLVNGNIVLQVKEATFKSNISEYNSELSLYLSSSYVKSFGTLEFSSISATKTEGTAYDGKTITQIITSMKPIDAYKFKIQDGILYYTGNDENEIKWSNDVGTINIPSVTKPENKPVLSVGMTPVSWNGSAWVNTTEMDTNWYDYENEKWANVKTVDGSMWVWIPRFIYKISSGWHTKVAGVIDIQFSIRNK